MAKRKRRQAKKSLRLKNRMSGALSSKKPLKKVYRNEKGQFAKKPVKKKNKKSVTKKIKGGNKTTTKLPSRKKGRSYRLPVTRYSKRSKNSSPVRTHLAFLDNNFVPRKNYQAWEMPWEFHRLERDNRVSIYADILEKLCENWRKRHLRGRQSARLMINFDVKHGRGRPILHRTVGTRRYYLDDSSAWQELLLAYYGLVLTLYDYDVDKYNEGDTDARYYITSVVLELIHTEITGSVSL